MKNLKIHRIVLSSLVLGLLLCVNVSARELYVDASRLVDNQDGTKEKPFNTIQKAADIAEPGDIVLVSPGIYYESVTLTNCGTKENPIIFRALDSGENKTIITCANQAIREGKQKWTLEDDELQLYSVPYNRNVTRVMYNGANAVAYKSLNELKTFIAIDGEVSTKGNTIYAPKHGFFWDKNAQKLYVRLRPDEKYGSRNPNNNLMCVGGPYYDSVTIDGKTQAAWRYAGISKDSYCFGITSEKSSNVVLYGFTFETPGWCGVFIRAHDVKISNCWFNGCMSAIVGGQRTWYDLWYAQNIVVEYCDWDLWPTYQDSMELVREPKHENNYGYNWWFTKASMFNIFDYEAACFTAGVGNNWIIRNNKMAECLDSLSYAFTDNAVYDSEEFGGPVRYTSGGGIDMYENRFENVVDNAIEFENNAHDIDVHNNEFVSTFAAISWQPLGGLEWPTNLKVHHNIFYNDPSEAQAFKDGANFYKGWLKLGAATSNWSQRNMKYEQLDPLTNHYVRPMWLQDKGLEIYNNTAYLPGLWTSEYTGELSNFKQNDNNIKVVNNIFYGLCQNNPPEMRKYIPAGKFTGENSHNFDTHAVLYKNNAFIPSNPEETEIKKGQEEGEEYETFEQAGLYLEGIILKMKGDSPLKNSGMQMPEEREYTKYVGAVPYGGNWHINYSPHSLGDVDCNGTIDIADSMLVSKNIGIKDGQKGFNTRCDLNFDGTIDEVDLEIALEIITNN